MISSVALIGTGNVAYHLIKHFQSVGLNVEKVFGRTTESFEKLDGLKGFEKSLDLSKIQPNEFDLIVLAVSDDSIKEVIKQLPELGKTILTHTSGATSIDTISVSSKNVGVFYPLQTFSIHADLDFRQIPICVEASDKTSEEKLISFSDMLGCKSYKINSDQRKKLHLAAVFANNFTNYLLGNAENILSNAKLDLKLLEPLVKETIHKAFHSGPSNVQTGPAKRDDQKTIETHLEMIDDDFVKLIYRNLSEGINKKYN